MHDFAKNHEQISDSFLLSILHFTLFWTATLDPPVSASLSKTKLMLEEVLNVHSLACMRRLCGIQKQQ